jgi:hypothetical protein
MFRITGTTGEQVNGGNLHALRELHRFLKRLMMAPRYVPIGMEGVPLAGERADLNLKRLERPPVLLEPLRVCQQRLQIAVSTARIGSGTDFDVPEAVGSNLLEHALERQVRKENSKDAQLHGVISWTN